MPRENPLADAVWIMETFIDNFAHFFEASERTLFFGRIAELALERYDHGERHDEDSEPRTSEQRQ